VQFALGRYAADGELRDGAARRLNLLTAAGIVLLDSVGNSQVRAQEVLTAGSTSLPGTFRFEANTTAAFYTALLVAVYYAAQGLRAGEDGRPVGKRAAGAKSR
jgi:hypothetical protein